MSKHVYLGFTGRNSKSGKTYKPCHSCPISKDIQTGVYKGVEWNKVPCSTCSGFEGSCIRGHGRRLSIEYSIDEETGENSHVISASIEAYHKMEDDVLDREINNISNLSKVLNIFTRLEPLEREAVVGLIHGKTYRALATELSITFNTKVDFRRLHSKIDNVLNRTENEPLKSVIKHLHRPKNSSYVR